MSDPLEARKAETREIIVKAAVQMFSEKGYHKTQVADIVRFAGISTGSIYAHFKDKRDLFEQISRQTLEELRLRLQKARRTVKPGDARERIRRWVDEFNSFFDYVDAHPYQVLMIIKGGLGVDEEFNTLILDSFSAFASDIAEDFWRWQDSGILEGVNTSFVGQAVAGMSIQVALIYLMNGTVSRTEAIDLLTAMLHGIVDSHLTDRGRALIGDMRAPAAGEGQDARGTS